ncbi:MAG TPA: CheR family methyltransferase [Bryobacteraceae bacterium]|jgi:two-component system CheB/CheR fusion protein
MPQDPNAPPEQPASGEQPGSEQPGSAVAPQDGQPRAAETEPVPGADTQAALPPAPEPTEPIVVSDGSEETGTAAVLPYMIVGIGASAGGVEAYIELFRGLAADTGMSFVVIPHLLATQKSHLVEILGRSTSMPVEEITEGLRPEPNHVYILPPGTRARLERGYLRLDQRYHSEGVPRPIDFFFRSLANDQKSRAVGVVLSGTDADGALGLKAIKGEGGIAIVQSPESARFSEMPLRSISVDHVDRVLPPGQIGVELSQLAQRFHEPVLRTLEEGTPPPGGDQHFLKILNLLRGLSGIDFRLYKPTTIRRRIARRMLLHPFHTMAEYGALLQTNPKELRALLQDALIDVTRFFRDPPVFEALQRIVLPHIFEDRLPDQQVRIWVPGCSSGEEAYSIAIILLEYLTNHPLEPPIQIFGTDASESNIQKARAGAYPESIAGEVSADRLRRFFVKVDKGYQVSKRVRDLCIFARQNLCVDPPFSRMDLISCRNVLIYMGGELQKQILPMFHYSLREHGYLLLGTSESIREFTNLFQLIDRKHKLFQRIGSDVARAGAVLMPRAFPIRVAPEPAGIPQLEHWSDLELQRAADRIVLGRFGPPAVIVDEKMELIQSRGNTSPFIGMGQGAVSFQLSRMLRESIVAPVTHAVRRAIEQDAPVHVDGLQIRDGDREYHFAAEVLPIHSMAPRSRCFLVLFTPSPPRLPAPNAITEDVQEPPDQGLVERLGQELSSAKLYLQTLLEERDANNQELLSANEEIQSANEEMQSTNEELQTTKEELQSSNEELQTVNDELQQRNAILTQTSNDLTNLLNSVNLPVLMLNNEMIIRHFTPPTQKLMNLRLPDIGRPFSEIRLNLNVDDLQPLFTEVLETLAPREIEVQDKEGCWYALRVRPYRTADNKIDGIVVVLLDVDLLRRSQQELRQTRDFAQGIIENVPLPLAVVDMDLRIRTANDAFRTLAGIPKLDLQRRFLPELAVVAWGLEEPLRARLEEFRVSHDARNNFQFEFKTPGEPVRVLLVRGTLLKPDGDTFLLITVEDITARREVERLSGVERDRLANKVESTARELGRTREELRMLAGSLFTSQEDERRRVARELHDDISQKLAALEIDTQQIEKQLAQGSGGAAEEIEKVRAGIAALSEDVRNLSHALHPAVLEDLGVASGIRSLVEDFQERENMIVNFTAQDVPGNLPGAIAIGLYRITQEALRNVSKHAGRTHVKVLLKGSAASLRLQVADSGHGFDPRAPRSGLGLISMEERARLMQGTFTVESQPGEGSRITVDVPWPQPV